MPIYEFKCQGCNHRFEELVQRSNQMEGLHCPQCNALEVNRIMSSFGFSSGSVTSYSSSAASCSSCHSKNCSTCGS